MALCGIDEGYIYIVYHMMSQLEMAYMIMITGQWNTICSHTKLLYNFVHNMNALFQCHGHFDAIFKHECVFEIYDWMLFADDFSICAILYMLKHPKFIVHINAMM